MTKLPLRGLSVYLWLHIWVVRLRCPTVATVGWIWKDSLKASLVGMIRTVGCLATILLRHLELEKSHESSEDDEDIQEANASPTAAKDTVLSTLVLSDLTCTLKEEHRSTLRAFSVSGQDVFSLLHH